MVGLSCTESRACASSSGATTSGIASSGRSLALRARLRQRRWANHTAAHTASATITDAGASVMRGSYQLLCLTTEAIWRVRMCCAAHAADTLGHITAQKTAWQLTMQLEAEPELHAA